MYENQTLLITGGTGSFGKTVLSRIMQTDVKEIRIFSRDESKQEELRIALSNDKLKFYIGDVRDRRCVSEAMRGVDLVFHAAALKQVPSCEFYPLEAMMTNCHGTENVITAARDSGVRRVVALSTDKAVYPINAMGMSKAMMEKLVTARARLAERDETVMCCTRYGNVMASRGSVIPLFISQIKSGEPLTITDPNMTRFLMSLDESVDLVDFAFSNGRQGDILVQKSAASTVQDLAQALLELFETELPIKTIGTRHGEKLYETLLTREELTRADDLGGYYRVPADNRSLNYNKFFSEGELTHSATDDYHSHNTMRLDVEQIKKILLKVPYVLDELRGRGIAVTGNTLP